MNFVAVFVAEVIIALVGVITGLFCIINPQLVIQLQQRFYAIINWKIEPISVVKEVRNTKIMGYFSLITSMVIMVLITKLGFGL